MRRSLSTGDLTFGSVKKYLLILFLPSCKTVRHESKVTEKENQRLHRKTLTIQVFLPTKFKLKFGLLSKGSIFDARCKGIGSCPKKYIETKQKIRQLRHSEC